MKAGNNKTWSKVKVILTLNLLWATIKSLSRILTRSNLDQGQILERIKGKRERL